MQANGARRSVMRLLAIGGALMVVGYAMSCLSRLYDVAPGESTPAVSPVIPDVQRLVGRSWASSLAEPPLVAPPPSEQRATNYWAMDKRIVSQSFVFFSSGFAFTVYAAFVWACDLRGWSLGLFRTFGQNPLAAYLIHYAIDQTILSIVPKDSPLPWVMIWLVVAFGLTYLFVRFLERRQLYLRL
jgi:hypothetical protein